MSTCSKCPTYVCRTGDTLHIPDNCPMQQDFPETLGLYSSPDILRVSQAAALVESTGYCRWTRVEEVMEFSSRAGIKKLGIAFCSGMLREAKALAGVLEANGFEVVSDLSKEGEMPLSCDPIGQALSMNKSKTGLNIIFGMCVGHDSLFIKHSEALITCLVAKDRLLVHNPVAALYGAEDALAYTPYSLPENEEKAGLTPEDICIPGELFQHPEIYGVALSAAHVSKLDERPLTRLEETMEFARRLRLKKLGLVFCVGLRIEAKILTETLEANGFEVFSAACKTGGVPKEAIGILDSEKVRPGTVEPMCNPIAQAILLNRSGVELTILMGQCVGHDSLSIKHLEGWVTCLVTKDRVLAHNPIGAIYGAKGYFHRALYQNHKL